MATSKPNQARLVPKVRIAQQHAVATKLVPAAGYVRMSSDKQETSPAQQKAEIEKYAKTNGYKLVRWYKDEGISGDDTERRVGFKRMIGDAATGEFEAIICWDQDRFGRFDLIEAGKWISPLRDAGVHLATVTHGLMDWSDLAGRMMYGIQQEFKHQFLRDLSKNVVRGMEDVSREGKWVGGIPPVGYMIGPERRLVLGSPEDVEFVQWVFAEYLRGYSLRGICDQLAQTGRLSPRTKKNWTATGIKSVLNNPAYLGHSCWNRSRCGRYRKRPRQAKYRDRAEWIVVENTHPAIIASDVFLAAQDRLANNRGTGVSGRPGSPSVLSGLLYCGHCGTRMQTSRQQDKVVYTCYQNRQFGACDANRIRQDYLLAGILRELRDQYFNDDTIARLRDEMRKILKEADRPALKVQKHHLDATEQKLEQARRRLVEVPVDMIPIVADRVRELTELRDRQMAAVKAVNKPANTLVEELDARIQKAVDRFARIEQVVQTADPIPLREMLRSVVDRVEVYFRKVSLGVRKHRYELERAIIYFHGICADPAEDANLLGEAARNSQVAASSNLLRIEWKPCVAA